MRKIVKILGLSYSQSQTGSYIVVLSEKKGKRKLPIVIKPSDAQQIALKLEGVKSPRPLTHDLFKSLTDSYGIKVEEIYIHSIIEGVFYTKVVTSIDMEQIEIECTAGDGIALSIVYDCPIFVSNQVLEVSGIYIKDDGTEMSEDEKHSMDVEEDDGKSYDDLEEVDFDDDEYVRVSVEDLERMMEHALSNEEYEIAAEIRDRINELKKENNN